MKKIYVYFLCLNMVSFRGQKKLGLRPDRSLLGVLFKISDGHPHPFHMRRPPPALNPVLFFLCSKAFSWIIFPVIFGASNHHLVDENN